MIWIFIALVLLGVVAVATWVFLSLPESQPTNPESIMQEWALRNVPEESTDYYTASLITKHGFISDHDFALTGKILDIRYWEELPLDRRYIIIDPSVIGNQEKLESALHQARVNINSRAFRYRQAQAKQPAEVNNLQVPTDVELLQLQDELEQQTAALGGQVTIKKKTVH